MTTGLLLLRNTPPAETTTVIVTGVARSGTSMAAAVLTALGIPMGDSWAPAVYEDERLCWSLSYHHHELRRQLAAERDAQFPRWGFKMPGIHNALHPPELAQFRTPRLVLMVRDTLAVAQSAQGYDRDMRPTLEVVRHIQAEQEAAMRFAELAEVPAMLLSYEKFLAAPTLFIKALAVFVGLQPDDEAMTRAVLMVDPGNAGYREVFGVAA